MDLETNLKSNTPQVRGKRLRILRNMAGLTIHKLAEKYGIGSSTIKYWEAGRGEGLSVKGAEKIIATMRQEGVYCTFGWLVYGIDMCPQIIDMRQSISVQQITTNTITEEEAIANEMNMFRDNTANAVTFVIADDGMETFYSVGDIVGGNRLTGLDINRALGKNCIIEIEGNKLLCRKLMHKWASDAFVLCPLNSQTTTSLANLYNVKIISAAPISRVWKHVMLMEIKV